MERKPISDAPKDGRKVLLWIGNEACTGQWDEGVSHYDYDHDEWIDGGWCFDRLPAHGCGCCANNDTQPTHYSEIDQ